MSSGPINFQALAEDLLARARSLLPQWLPGGKFRGHEFQCGDLSGNAGTSLSINVNTGKWADFATGDKGGDLISLYAAIHRMGQGEAAKELGADEFRAAPQRPAEPRPAPEPARRVITPVPVEHEACACEHPKFGEPARVWAYRDAAGDLMGYVARYEPEGERKQIVPWTYTEDGWGMGQWPEPRPLYGLDRLAQRAGAPVMLVEGEKAADAALELAPPYVPMTWSGGAQAWKKADWSPLRGRKVLLWPDADEAGIKAMQVIGAHLLELGAAEVKVLNVEGMADGWDAADALEEGWDWDQLVEWAKPRAKLLGSAKNTPRGPTTPQAGNVPVGEANELPTPGSSAGAGKPGRGHSQAPAPTPPARPQLRVVAGTDGAAARQAEMPPLVQMWAELELDLQGHGRPLANLNNAVRILERRPEFQGLVWYDEFLQRYLTTRDGAQREWTDGDDVWLALTMQRVYGIQKMEVGTVNAAVQHIAAQGTRNEVKEWLESLRWDGTPRLEAFLTDIFGAEDSEYTRAAGRNFWISMAARAYRPGCKVDNMIVLEGAQGLRKSTALAVVGGKWFAEAHESVTSKDFYITLQGKLLVEIGEMDAFSRAETTKVKQVISCASDRYRAPYGRVARDWPRQGVFAATTNKDDWNRDETGARRFWPVRCAEVNLEALRGSRDQYFAEAVALFKQGASWWEMPADATRAEQEDRRQHDEWEGRIADYVQPRDEVTVGAVLEKLNVPVEKWDKSLQMRVASVLRTMGWKRVTAWDGEKAVKRWLKGGKGGNGKLL